MAHTISSCECSLRVRRRGWLYVAARMGKRGRGRVIILVQEGMEWLMCRGQNVSGGGAAVKPTLRKASPQWWVISGEREARVRGQVFLWELQRCGALLQLQSHTHLDCGSVSLLSFNSSSETSVSRISGLDLFPYLETHKETVRQRWWFFKLTREL